tara:strand:+ start:270 stop:539 length:270 start_codon:yes stop_codon:yes gene_type:complete
MQKLINILSLASFAVSASIVGAGTYVYVNKDAIIDNVKEAATKAATEAVTGALPGMMDSSMPELPKATGGAIPTIPGVGGVSGSSLKMP